MNKVKLKEICRLINGRAYKQHELLDNGKYPVLRVGNFFSDKGFYYSDMELEEDKYCDNGDLLFAWSASFGPKIWDGGKVIYHYHIWKMELSEKVDKNYLYYYLYHLSERIKSEGHGGIMIHTTKAEMEEREFVLPELTEQKAIANILAKVFSVIEMRKKELYGLDELIKARFVELFGDPITNTKNLTTNDLKDVLVLKAGDFTAASDIANEPTEKYKYPCYGGNGIRGYVAEYNQEGEYSLVGRQGALSGNVQYARGKFRNTEHALLVTPVVEMNSIWLNQLLINLDLKRYQTGAAQPGLSVKNLQEIQILSVPMVEQNEFANFVEQVDKSKFI